MKVGRKIALCESLRGWLRIVIDTRDKVQEGILLKTSLEYLPWSKKGKHR